MDDEKMSELLYIENLVKSRDYSLETYKITTEDGYILTMLRMKNEKVSNGSYNNQPPSVLLIHGLFSSCAEWVNEKNALGYFLADEGFDVWMCSCRGTSLSKKHVLLNFETEKDKYWDFSWHEIGYYDLAACIDFMILKTEFSKIFCIGYSQGTSSLLVLLSSRPEYNSKIAVAILLAPAGFYGPQNNLTVFERIGSRVYEFIFRMLGAREDPFVGIGKILLKKSTQPSSYFYSISNYIVFNWLSDFFKKENSDKMDWVTISMSTPNSGAMKQMIHYIQVARAKAFVKYDYGKVINVEKYGSETPPAYDLTKITAPVALFYAKQDRFCNPKDSIILEELLQHQVVRKYIVKKENFDHIDFVYNLDITTLLHEPILEVMKRYYWPDNIQI